VGGIAGGNGVLAVRDYSGADIIWQVLAFKGQIMTT